MTKKPSATSAKKSTGKPATKGLGKGLSALLGDKAAINAVGGSDLSQPNRNQAQPSAPSQDQSGQTGAQNLPIEQISSGLYQPRDVFDEDALNDLAESIKNHGIVQPLLVRPKAKGSKGTSFELIAGERRWRAAQKAGLHTVPCVIRDADDQMAAEIAMIENIQRRDLSVIEEAEGYRRLIEEFSYTQDALAKVIGKSRSHLANTMRLLQLPDDVRQHLKSGTLTPGQTRPLVGRDDAAALASQILNKGLSARQVEKLVAAQDRQPKEQPVKDTNLVALEDELASTTGLDVTVTVKNQGGVISIKYEDLDQFDAIINRLKNQ
mgnify:CR=1 FL=1